MMKNLNFKGCSMDLILAEDAIYLNGSSSECSGAILKGQLKLTTTSITKLSSISIDLVGIVKTSWNADTHLFKDKQILLQNQWTFVERPSKGQEPHLLPPGEHIFPFELALPGSLSPSIETSQGKVEYKLTGKISWPNMWWDQSVEKIVKLMRLPKPTCAIMNTGLHSQGTFLGMLDYNITCPYKAFGPTDQIPLRFQLTMNSGTSTKTNCPIKIESISCLVKKNVTFKAMLEDGSWMTKRKGHIMTLEHRDLTMKPINMTLDETLNLPIYQPNKRSWSTKHIPFTPDTINPLIEVTHNLKIKITIIDENNQPRDLLLKYDIRALPVPMSQIFAGLPTYGNDQNTLLLEADNVPPSYKSQWCPLNTRPSLSSLPGYESAISHTSAPLPNSRILLSSS